MHRSQEITADISHAIGHTTGACVLLSHHQGNGGNVESRDFDGFNAGSDSNGEIAASCTDVEDPAARPAGIVQARGGLAG